MARGLGGARIRVYRTEDLDDPATCRDTLDDLQRYLELPHHAYSDVVGKKFNRAPEDDMPANTRALLADFYAPYNRALEELLGRKLDWAPR